MNRFANYIALLLLAVFTRVLVPDALVLQLHAHEHTEHHSCSADDSGKYEHQLSPEHTHCPIEQVFNVPYQGVQLWVELVQPQHFLTHHSLFLPAGHTASPAVHFLRGPPAA